MIVQYGTFQHQVSSTGIVVSSDVEENESGVPIRVKHSVSIEGRLRNPPGATPRDLDGLIAQMESAYGLAFQYGRFTEQLAIEGGTASYGVKEL
ncbi:MAG: hypothetical protein ACKOAH_11080, partial [Pirellula sp.]